VLSFVRLIVRRQLIVCCYLLACLTVSNSLYCVCALVDLLFLSINDVERLFNRPPSTVRCFGMKNPVFVWEGAIVTVDFHAVSLCLI